MNDPAILVADEPTGNLDERATRGIFQLLQQINGGGTVVIMATHNLALVRGTDVTLKKFYRDPGGKVRLQPANAAMQPIFVDPDQVQIQGVVVGVMRKY